MVGAEGFEPTTPASQTLCATRLRYAPTSCLIIRDASVFVKYLSHIRLHRSAGHHLVSQTLA